LVVVAERGSFVFSHQGIFDTVVVIVVFVGEKTLLRRRRRRRRKTIDSSREEVLVCVRIHGVFP